MGSGYQRLLAATAASSLGDGLVFVAFPLLALTLTRSPLAVAGVTVAAQAPAFVTGPLAGALVDRVDRRRMVLALQAARLGVLALFAALVAAGHDSILALYLVVGTLGCADIAYSACAFATVPQLVPGDELERANGRLDAADLTAKELAGQGLGGLVFSVLPSLPFAADAASFLASALLLRRAIPANPPAPASATLGADIAGGLRWFAANGRLRLLAGVIGAFAFCQAAVLAVLVLYATTLLHTSHAGFGLLLAVGSAGGVGGSVMAGRATRRLGPYGAIAVSGVVAGAAYATLGLAHSVLLAGAALAAESGCVSVGNVASISLRQRLIPPTLLGRVGTTFRMTLIGAGVLGALAGGAIATVASIRAAVLVAAALQTLAVAGFAAVRPWRGRDGRPLPDGPGAGHAAAPPEVTPRRPRFAS